MEQKCEFHTRSAEGGLMNWNAISAVSSSASTSLVVVGAWIALRQWKESLASRQFQGMSAFIQQFQSVRLRSMREFLLSHSKALELLLDEPKPIEALDTFLREKGGEGIAKSVVELRQDMAVLEFVAVLSLNRTVPVELERSYLAPTIVNYWRAVRPVVKAIQAERGDRIYLQHVEALTGMVLSGELYAGNSAKIKRKILSAIEVQAREGALRRGNAMNSEKKSPAPNIR